MLVLYCWLIYGKCPHEVLSVEILSKVRPVAFLLDILWWMGCRWLSAHMGRTERTKGRL